MNETAADLQLSPEQEQTLACVLDELIPPSADGRLPGAGRLGLAAAVESWLETQLQDKHGIAFELEVDEQLPRVDDELRSVLSVSQALASPKSSTLTVPSSVILMLAGFKSRWTMPCSCAASSASAICSAMGIASSTGIGPRLMRSERSSPSTSSIARNVVKPASVSVSVPETDSNPYSVAIFG